MTLNFVLGTAAELIKLWPVISGARQRGWTTRLIASGQSRENLAAQLRDFDSDSAELIWLTPGLGDLASSRAALRWFWNAMRADAPVSLAGDVVVVHGDTLTSLVGARLGHRAGARVVHVEAGLRSPSLLNPFPEEINRRLVSRYADVHAAPDEIAAKNLSRARGRAFSTGGNTLIDAVRATAGASLAAEHRGEYTLVNVHRFENLRSKARWTAIIQTLLAAAEARPLLFIAHPPTRARLESDVESFARLRAAGVEFKDRVPFTQFISLLRGTSLLISDGGSNQEECSYLGVPCLLMREETERREGLGANCVLSRFDRALIARVLADPNAYRRPPLDPSVSPTRVLLDELAREFA